MVEILYYNPEISREIIDTLLGCIAYEPNIPESAQESVCPGAYILSACFYSMPDYAIRHLHWLEGYYQKYEDVEILGSAERYIRDKNYWVHAGEPCSSEEYFSTAGECHGINTFQFLFNCCVYLASKLGEKVPLFLRAGLNTLVNRFERFGRVYNCYDNRFEPASEKFSFLYNYFLLSVFLLKMFEKEGNIQYLSTSLKAIDLIPFLTDHIKDADLAMAALSPIFLGERILRGFYDTKKFRLLGYR